MSNTNLKIIDCKRFYAASTNKQFCGLIVIVVLLAMPTIIGLWKLWKSNVNFEGLILVPFMAAMLFYKAKRHLKFKQQQTSGLTIATLAISIVAMIIFNMNGFTRISAYCVLASLLFVFDIIFESNSRKYWIAPLFFMGLMIPMPLVVMDNGVSLLQNMLSVTVEILSPIFSANLVERIGNIFHFQNYDRSIAIAPECSGFRSLTGLIIATFFLGILDGHRKILFEVFILSGLLVALLLNLLRIIVSIQLQLIGLEKYTIGFWHGFLGLMVFVCGYIFLSKLSRCMEIK